jgi:hypothetical protein
MHTYELIGIRSLPDSPPNFADGPYAGGINSAILRYQGAPQVDPTTPLLALNNTLRESDLIVGKFTLRGVMDTNCHIASSEPSRTWSCQSYRSLYSSGRFQHHCKWCSWDLCNERDELPSERHQRANITANPQRSDPSKHGSIW